MKRVLPILILSLVVSSLWAYSGGISGQTTAGCTCHSTSSSTATSLSLSGPTTVNPGSTNTFTLTLQHSSRPAAGFNLAIVNSGGQNAGSLGTVSGQLTQIMSGELTHSQPKSLSGGSVSWQFTWQAPSTPGPYTVRAVGMAVNGNGSADGNDQWNFLQSVTITVKGITITAPTPSQILCAGGTVTIQWTSYGVSSVVVSLSSDGGNTFTPVGTLSAQDGQNSQSFTIPSTLQPGNQYRIRLTDATDNTISSTTQNLTLAAPTSITTHPQNAAVCEGANVTFSVTAAGSNLTYQWRRNGTNIPGATQATLTLPNVTQAQAGSYDCIVSGACGQPVTSNAATLTINPQTAITAHPQSATVCQGASITFTVAATGSNLRYQWRKGTQDIAGATASSYTIASVALADTGLYACIVAGDCGSQTSNQAQLEVALPPAITQQPRSQTLCEGQNLTLTVGINRIIANSYQWRKNGIPLSDGGRIQGAITSTLRITNLISDDAGNYTVEITNAVCQQSVTSDAAAVVVKAQPTITAQPQSKTVTRGSPVSLSVSATGPDLQYQWYHNNQAIAGATSATYTIPSAQDNHAGTYHVRVSNDCGTVESQRVMITISDAPTPVLELSHSTITAGPLRIGTRVNAQLVLYNRGTAPLRVTEATITGSGASSFSIALVLPLTIAVGDSAVATVTLRAEVEGTESATMTLQSNGGDRTIALSVTGVPRAIMPETLSLDTTVVGEHSVRAAQFCNMTSVPIKVDSIIVLGDDASAFALLSGAWQNDIQNPLPAAGASCIELPIRFQPNRVGSHRARLVFYSRQDTLPFIDESELHAEAVQSTSVAVADDAIRIMPNPATDVVTIDIGPRSGVLRIRDIVGNLVLETPVNAIYQWHTATGSGQPVAAGTYIATLILSPTRVTTFLLVIVR